MPKLTATDHAKIPMRERRKKERAYKSHLKQISEESTGYPLPAYPRSKNRKHTKDENEIAFYKRCFRGKRSRHSKRMCNASVRRQNGEDLLQGGLYTKVDDFWRKF